MHQLLRLSWPVVLGMLSGTIMGLIDLAMVGRLGAAEMAAVGLATTLVYAAIRTVIVLGSSVQAVVSRRVGEDRASAAGEVVRTGITLGLLIGAPLGAALMLGARPLMALFGLADDVEQLGVSYIVTRSPEVLFLLIVFVFRGFFEGIGRTVIPLLAGLVMLTANVFLNWCWIFGHLGFPAWGVAGAGAASAAASMFGAVILWWTAERAEFRVPYSLKSGLGMKRELVGTLLRVSWPNSLRTLLTIGAFSVFLGLIGRIGTLELAASNGVVRITSFSFMPGIGVGTAAGVLVGQALGRGDRALARRVGWHAVFLACAFMGSMGVLFLVAPELCLRIFTDDPEIIRTGIPVQRLLGLVQLFDAAGLALAMSMMGAGSTFPVMLGDVGTAYLIFLPLAWLLTLKLGIGLMGAWIALLVWFVAFAFVMIWLWRREAWAQVEV